jgi:hypothetical protein
MRRYWAALRDGLLAGLAYIGLFRLVGEIPFRPLIASAIALAVAIGVLRFVQVRRQTQTS